MQNADTTTAHLYKLLAMMFEKKQMIRSGTIKQYRCSIAYYLMSFISKLYQIVLDRTGDTPDHVKDVVDGFNAVQKRYLATCLRMRSTPEVHYINSKRMRVDAMA